LKRLVSTVFFAHGQRDKKLHPPGEGKNNINIKELI